MSDHKCHAIGCAVKVQPKLLMCLHHWRMVPQEIRTRVVINFRQGQCEDKKPSTHWLKAAREAITAVGKKEGKL